MKRYETAAAEWFACPAEDILTTSGTDDALKIGDCGEGVTLTWQS